MSDTITFTIKVSTNRVGSGDECDLEIYKEDLEGVPELEWDDYVWENLGGKEAAFEMLEMIISHNN